MERQELESQNDKMMNPGPSPIGQSHPVQEPPKCLYAHDVEETISCTDRYLRYASAECVPFLATPRTWPLAEERPHTARKPVG